MRLTQTLALALGIAVCGAPLWIARRAGAAPDTGTAGTRIAVVDMFEIMNASPRQRMVAQKAREQGAALDAYKQEQANKLRELDGKIEGMARANPERQKLEEEFARQKAMTEFEVKWRTAQADQVIGDAWEGLYSEVRGFVRDVAIEGGYGLVVSMTDDPLQLRRAGDFVMSVAMRPVIYYDKATNITALVKTRIEASKPPAGPK